MNKILNDIYKSKNPLAIFDTLDGKERHLLIRHLWGVKNDKNINIAKQLLQKFIIDEKNGVRNVHGSYINLLCILLAQTHDIQNLKEVILTKRSGDLFFYIDSNLLFEFTPKGTRDNCIKDTLKFVDENPDFSNEKWYEVFKDWVNNYAKSYNYDSNTIINIWEKYKTQIFKNQLNEILEYVK